MSTPPAKTSVKVSYIVHGNQVAEKEFNSVNVETNRLGLPLGSVPVKVSGDYTTVVSTLPFSTSHSFDNIYRIEPPPGDYSYSGVHDSGPLLPPKEGGLMADMISFVTKAKEFNDTFMTNIIEKEKDLDSSQENPPEMKKARK